MTPLPRPKTTSPLLVILLFGFLLSASATPRSPRACPECNQASPDRGQSQSPASQLRVIDCHFATGHDRILVYGANPERAGQDPAAMGDFAPAVWIFDARADGSAQLVVRFAAGPGGAIAYLFDDQDGDGRVAYQLRDGEVIITESGHWRVKAVASPTWLTPVGSVNPNITFFIDGPVLRYLSWGEAFLGPAWASRAARTDGHPDWIVEVVDRDDDGLADYQLQRTLSPFPPDLPVFRSTLYVDRNPAPPLSYPATLFWPLLVSRHAYETYNYFDHPPVIAVDWDRARIDRVGILGYPAEQGYHVNSRAAWAKGRINYADFENPMAYYDLAADRDGRPELFVRFEVFAPHDRFFLNGSHSAPMTEVEYAWDQDDDGRWDYQLSLAGANPITSTLDFPDFSVRSLPYDRIPAWVAARSWSAAVFVAAEDGGYWNSEGMSVWNVNRGDRAGGMIQPSGLRDEYLAGLSDQPPLDDYSEIPSGFRGELAFDFFHPPTLYLSAIDRRLHLKYATRGLWAIGPHQEIRYSNLSAGPYLDHWQYYIDAALHQELALLRDTLLYAGDNEIRLKTIAAGPALSRVEGPALFETPPPRDHAGWLTLRARLAQNASPPGPLDLLEMYSLPHNDRLPGDQPPGNETRIRQASIHDLRRADAGFRFVVHLAPGYSVIGDDALSLRGRPPGSYLVLYDGRFQVQALTPASLVLRPEPRDESLEPLQQYLPGQIRLRIANLGLADAHQVTATARISQPDREQAALPLDPQTLDIPAGETVMVNFPWTPRTAGAYSLQFEATWLDENGDPATTETLERTLTVLPAEQPRQLETFGIFGLVHPGKVILLLVLVTVVAGLAATSISSSQV